jgi:hypothetical protein
MFTLAFQSLTLYPSWVINIESNQETPTERKSRLLQAARYLKRFPNPNGDAVTFAPIKKSLPAPGKSVTAQPTASFSDGTPIDCPICAERKRKHAAKVARLRARNRHAN